MKKVFALFAFVWAVGAFAQVPNVKFGQNRVQYKDFIFSYYPTEHFTVYFYQGGQDIGKYVVKASENYYEELAKQLDVRTRKKTNIIVYNTLEDLNQTNIGIYDPDQNQAGTAELPVNRIFIYFDGNHERVDEQLKAGIARVLGVRALAGKEKETKFYRNLPDWFNSGLNTYLSKQWTALDEDKVRDGILSKRFSTMQGLSEEEQRFLGYAIFHYIEEKYGKTAVTNLIYITRLNRSTDYGLQFSIGVTTKELLTQWYAFYRARYERESLETVQPRADDSLAFKVKKERDYYQTKISPDGKYIAYAENQLGRVKIHLLNNDTYEDKVIFRYGWRTKTLWKDLQFPLIAFKPQNDKLAIVWGKRNESHLLQYNLKTGEKTKAPIRKFQKVTSISYMPDGKSFVVSAIQKGQSDIFTYNIGSTTTKQITDDYFDDFEPAYVEADGFRGIMFTSNRTDDTLRKEKYDNQTFKKQTDIFLYDTDAEEVYQITNTPLISERSPAPYSSKKYQFLSDANGITNIHTGAPKVLFDHYQINYFIEDKETEETDSLSLSEGSNIYAFVDTQYYRITHTTKEPVYKVKGENHQLTNFASDIHERSFGVEGNDALCLFLKNGKPALYKFELDVTFNNENSDFLITERISKQTKVADAVPIKEKSAVIQSEMIIIDEDGPKKRARKPYDFQSEFDFMPNYLEPDSAIQNSLQTAVTTPAQTTSTPIDEIAASNDFKQSKVRPYFVRFMVDKIITQLNNDPIITTYQPFNPASPQYTYQPVNLLFKLGITDVLENHKIYGGFTFPLFGNGGFSFTNLGWFLTYENLKKRWDKKMTFYRQSVSGTSTTTIPGSSDGLPINQSVDYSIKTNYLSLEFKYPFDVFHAIKLGADYRNDRYVFKSMDSYSHFLNDNVIHTIIGKVEYTYDNSYEVMENIRSGARIRVFTEIFKDIPTKLYKVGDSKWRLPNMNNTIFSEVGVDARYYQKIYKQMIVAARATFNTSIGNAKMMHYIGGTENNILASIPAFGAVLGQPNNNAGAPVDGNVNYIYQTIVSPVRGFLGNTRNGSNAATMNLELRIPLFSVLAKNKLRSEFLRTFQIVGFVDAGSAWSDWSIFKGNYPVFYERYTTTASGAESNTTIFVRKVKAPVVVGTGFGFRVSLGSFFTKFDTAWGFDSGAWSKKPVLYLGFGYDF